MSDSTGRPTLAAWLFFAALLASNLVLFEPIESLLLNLEEVHTDSRGVVLTILPGWLLVLALAMVFALLVRRLVGGIGLAVLIGVTLALWLQANVFVWHYGEMDGTPIDWSENAGKGAFEVLCWLSLLILCVKYSRAISARWLSIGAVILLLNVVAVGSAYTNRSVWEAGANEAQDSDAKNFGIYSNEKNVIVIVLDGLQSDIFSQVLRDSGSSPILPPGFVYYRNAVSLYVRTQFSLPSILSGEAAPNRGNLRKFVRLSANSWLPMRLANEGWNSSLASFASFLRQCESGKEQSCVNLNELTAGSSLATQRLQQKTASDVLLLSLFRSAPHFLKQYVYDEGEWQLPYFFVDADSQGRDERIHPESRLDLDAFESLTRDARVEGVPPQFRLVHFFGMHFPATLNPHCEFLEEAGATFRRRFVATTQCLVSQLDAYLKKLEALGVYDNSLIVVVADHGSPIDKVDPSAATSALPANISSATAVLDNAFRGLPVFLVKDFGARHPLRISDRPVSLCDVPATVYDALNMENDTSCFSIFGDGDLRPPRRHFRYPSYKEQKAMSPESRNSLEFTPYHVLGHSWWPESWQPAETP